MAVVITTMIMMRRKTAKRMRITTTIMSMMKNVIVDMIMTMKRMNTTIITRMVRSVPVDIITTDTTTIMQMRYLPAGDWTMPVPMIRQNWNRL